MEGKTGRSITHWSGVAVPAGVACGVGAGVGGAVG
jgi:hypothetical protein